MMKTLAVTLVLLGIASLSTANYYSYGGGYNMYNRGRSRALYIPYPVPTPVATGGGAAAAPPLPLGGFGLGFGLGQELDDNDGLFGGDGSIFGLILGGIVLLSLFGTNTATG